MVIVSAINYVALSNELARMILSRTDFENKPKSSNSFIFSGGRIRTGVMKAMVLTEFDRALEYRDVDHPSPGDNDIVIKVTAAGMRNRS
jgi:hypothetical protein